MKICIPLQGESPGPAEMITEGEGNLEGILEQKLTMVIKALHR